MQNFIKLRERRAAVHELPWSQRILESLGYHMVKSGGLYLTWPWIRTGSWQTERRTDRQRDRIPIPNTRSQQYLPVLLWRVKNCDKNNTVLRYRMDSNNIMQL